MVIGACVIVGLVLLLIACGLLCVAGLCMFTSALYKDRQLVWMAVGFLVASVLFGVVGVEVFMIPFELSVKVGVK